MQYSHTVKHKGKFYLAGEEVPENDTESPVLNSDEDTPQEYSKTKIMRMAKADLIDLAIANGMTVDESMSGDTLKEMLVEKLVK